MVGGDGGGGGDFGIEANVLAVIGEPAIDFNTRKCYWYNYQMD